MQPDKATMRAALALPNGRADLRRRTVLIKVSLKTYERAANLFCSAEVNDRVRD
jgi:hypothetical protein